MESAVCFSDIDGTLVHSEAEQARWGVLAEEPDEQGLYAFRDTMGKEHHLIKMPVSLTYSEGVISVSTLHKLARVRSVGIPVTLITGARTMTLLQRLPFLPLADAYVSENGGRIFYHKPALPSAVGLVEDMAWRRAQNRVVGPHQQESRPPEDRAGLLWDLYRDLLKDGWNIDARGYTTCLRIKSPPEGKAMSDINRYLLGQEDLAHSDNLGTMNVYAASSGKANAGLHVMHHFSASPKLSVFLCDDDNDIGLARNVGRAFLPSITQESMQRAVEEDPDHFEVVRDVGGTLATDKALDAVLAHYEIDSEMDSDDDEEEGEEDNGQEG
ncbi:unnamed protein product [Ostreobium quekettii]|uniref:Sucrose phosphatase-like domain-containing protein n=1 Tax=Ostreobium quekettii TaxID=121088 RepID=A0A8S1IRH8_9CHLO|nr:unnamed protein product [Ostreobium quekettii]|eukprot:evm.model.scf_788EXC.1 EVM.evm.TU.scf_788EXC.1   scf_788EXC:6347-14930(+)